jgi:hypothetical protein
MDKTKYPRTVHLDWSPGMTDDDRKIRSYDSFLEKEVVVTIKMDGENTTAYSDGFTHARSLNSGNHVSREFFKKFWNDRAYLLEPNYRICGENLYARHSISYDSLPTYFMGFSVWDQEKALDWDSTVEIFQSLDIITVPVIYRGPFDLRILRALTEELDTSKDEGIVVRVTEAIPYKQFHNLIAKWVRSGHVQTNRHWAHNRIVPNCLNQTLIDKA